MTRGEKIRNVGPKSAAWLRQVGVRSLDDLRELGVVPAFMKVRRAGFRPSLNLLYAMEGALRDCHWQEVPEARRGELLTAVDAAESIHVANTARAVGVVTERQGSSADGKAEDGTADDRTATESTLEPTLDYDAADASPEPDQRD